MAKIKVTRGGCGVKYKDANGIARHTLKTPESGAFECDDEQAERLVRFGVAEYVDEHVNEDEEVSDTSDEEEVSDGSDEEQEKAGESQETEEDTGHLDADQLNEMSYNELKKLAADMGVKPEGKTKADYIAALVAAEVIPGDVADSDEDDDNELPELNAADPE